MTKDENLNFYKSLINSYLVISFLYTKLTYDRGDAKEAKDPQR